MFEILENAIAAKKGKWQLNFGDDYAKLQIRFIDNHPSDSLQHLPKGNLNLIGSISGFSVELKFDFNTDLSILSEILKRIKTANDRTDVS